MRGLSTVSFRRLSSSLMCVLWVVSALLPLYGQESSSVSKNVDTQVSEPAKKEAPKGSAKLSGDGVLPPATVQYLPNKNGELFPVRKDLTFEDYVKFVENRNKSPLPPVASIKSVDITGVAEEDRVNLKVTLTIQLQQGDQWTSVPLFFNEAMLLESPVYTGTGYDAPDEKDPERGYIWWFKGGGLHRLEMSLRVPLKKSLPSRRLVVSLPPQSPVCRATITLPYTSVNAKVVPDQAVLEVISMGEKKTAIDVYGLGSKLDLTWQPIVDVRPNEVSLEAQTTIWAQIESDHVLIRAEQQVKSLQGLIEQVVVRLPAGADLVKFEDLEKQSFKYDTENRQKVIVTLKEKSNSAQIGWTLRLPAKLGSPLTIDGFIVDGARKQVGKIGISTAEGLRLSDRRDPTLVSINAGEFPDLMGPVVRAYQFLSQPFKLLTTFDEVKPYFQVKPKLTLTASAQQLALDAEFEFHVDRDSLSEVVLTWPQHKAEGWTIDAVDEPGVVESFRPVDDKGQITARLVKNRSGRFSVHLRAHRHIKAGDEFSFTMPRPKSASRLSPSILILVNAENVDTDLTAKDDTVFHLISSSSLDLPEIARGLKATAYQVETEVQSFGLRVIPQKQRIRTESFTEAAWQNNQFRIKQRLIYDVAYERLSQIRVSVPPGIDIARIGFFTSTNDELSAELLPATGNTRQILLKLREAQLGRFEVQARFLIPFAKDSAFDSDAVVAFPILGSSDESFSRTRFSLAQSDWFDAEPLAADSWQPQLNRQEALEWMADGAQNEVSLKLIRSTHSNETGSVSRALIKVFLNENGEASIRAQFRMITRATSLPVVLPSTSQPPIFFWDQYRLSEREYTESPSESRRYTIQLPEDAEKAATTEHLLTIDYQDSFGGAMGCSDRVEVRSPQLPSCSWAHVTWQTILPASQHILTYPDSASPMFRWQRTGIFWGRVSHPGPEKAQEWVTKGTMGILPISDNLVSEKNGNLYTFSQFDAPRPLVFQTLSSSMVLFFGAGFSLVVGFVMLRVAFLRHVLTLLVMALIIATAGLWYIAPLELLLQPMIAGLLFPATAVALESWVRRRYDNSVLSFGGQGDFPPMHAFDSHYVVRQTDPNEATTHRPPNRDSESGIPVESGSGVS